MEFATGALGTLLPKLGQLLQDEYNLHKGAKKNIEFLTRELQSIQAALRIVGEVPPEQLSELVKIWGRDARELSYDMEGIVDTFLVRIQGPEPERPSKKSSKRFIKKMMDFVTKVKTRHEISQDIKDVKELVKEVAERRDRYRVDSVIPARTLIDPRLTSLYTKTADLVGIDETSEELIRRLTKRDNKYERQKIVSIVGCGGLGKTTLVKAVYDKLKGQFDCIAFVPVGRNPDLKKVFMDILIDLNMHLNLEILDERQLIGKLREFLENKRYFLVIDDVWDTESWATIKLALVENNNASRIIITTRTHQVAIEAGEVYKLKPLTDDNSRKLFFARISGGESKPSDNQPDKITDKIISKCDGIPLAIITMASMLAGKPREAWSEVNLSISFGNKGNQQVDNTMKILCFSYYDLPSHLRTCLLHLSMFPEDSFIEKRPLIWTWIAEGFVHEKKGVPLFEIGEGYFNDLVNRSMIQLVEELEGFEMVCGCQVHDMVLDLIRSISSEENFVTISDNNAGTSSSTQGKVRRLALQNGGAVEAHVDIQQVRSLVLCGCDIDRVVPFSSFKLVRVLAIHSSSLSIKCCHLKHLRHLLHLRYLRLSGASTVELPKEIGTLKFLQTLDVEGFVRISDEEAAISLGRLTQLLCLRFRCPVPIMPIGIGQLTSLEELQIHYYERDEEPWKRFVKELGSLRALSVLRLGLFTDVEELQIDVGMVESLRNLQMVEHLSLMCCFQVSTDTAAWEEAGFLLPRCLRELFLDRIWFSQLPTFCINPSRLPNLSHLSLRVDVIDEQDLRILGGLPELRYLKLGVQFTTELVCNTTTDAAGDGHLFEKLRHCSIMCYDEVRLLFLDDYSGGGVWFRMWHVHASMLLGSEVEDVCSGKGVAPTLMPSVQKLWFTVSVRELKDHSDNNDCGMLVLEYFASLQNATVTIDCSGASAAEVEELEAALRFAADIHPNRPTLKVSMSGEEKMVSAA